MIGSLDRHRLPSGREAFPGRIRFPLKTGLVAVVLAASGCAQSQVDEPPPFTLVEAGRQYLEIIVEAAGELEPLRTVEVMSKASGEVIEVLVDTGDRVQPGSLLARIDPRDVQNDFNQAEADFGVAVERLDIAEAQLRRSESLLEAGVITEQEHEGRDLEYANSQASLVRAETNLALARLRLADVTIGSPLDGTVLVKNVEEGQVISSPSGNVSGGTVLLTIADLSVMQVKTLVNEADVGRIEPDMPATVYVDAFQDRSFEGVVEKIEPQAEVVQNVVNFPVIVRLDNSEGILKPGMSANVSFLLAERPNAITLPNNAIVAFDEMTAAASVLGVPDERLQMDPSVFQELRREMAGGAPSVRLDGADGVEGVRRGRRGGGGQTPENLQRLRERMQGGELSQEEIQAIMQQARSGGGGFGAGRGGAGGFGRGAGGGGFGPEGGAQAGAGRGSAASDTDGRSGIVFVEGKDGTLSPRAILIGVTDWSNSEILAGLEEGERVALIAVAGMQDENSRGFRFRGRMGIPFMR